jgi:predicted AlkP superfamily phosphohydrolase/phosphomutase/Tfp pilus assembly protein PilF
MQANSSPRLLLIAWDGAEWDLIGPLIDAGDLPHLGRLIDHGVTGRMATLHSALAPLAWNSVATGRSPEEHGVLGYFEPDEDGRGVRSFRSTRRRTRAIWEILSERKFETHVIGWPASHPAQRINGLTISEIFDEPVDAPDVRWPVPAGSVEPDNQGDMLGELRMHPGEVTRQDLKPFVPDIETIDPRVEPAVLRLAQPIALAASRHAVATYLLQNEPWNFCALYQPALERISREFLQFYPPRLAGIPEADFVRYQNVVRQAYQFHDAMLGRLLEVAGEDATVLVCSTCGFQPGFLRAPVTFHEKTSSGAQHRSAGWFAFRGPRLRKDELLFGARLYDIAPTILALFGVPIGKDLRGRVWEEAFCDRLAISFVPSWEPKERPLADERPPSLVPGSAAFVITRENDLNLARCLQAAGRHREALPLLEQVCRDLPERIEAAQQLSVCYRALGRTAESRRVLENIARLGESSPQTQAARFSPQLDLMRGLLDLDEGKRASALQHFALAQEAAPQLPGMHLQLGGVYLRLRLPDDAARAFRRALEIDPDNPAAHHGLSLALYRRRHFDEACEHALEAAARAPWVAAHHLQLGLCLARVGQKTEAIVALTHAVERERRLLLAHRVLARLHAQPPANGPAHDFHRAAVGELRRARKKYLTPSRDFE